jgi:hypothetical protein
MAVVRARCAPYLSASVFSGAGQGGILVSTSSDGGVSWSDPVLLIAEADQSENHSESVTADPTDKDLVFGVWTHFPAPNGQAGVQRLAFFARSSGGGTTWRRARQIFDPGPNGPTTPLARSRGASNHRFLVPDQRARRGTPVESTVPIWSAHA